MLYRIKNTGFLSADELDRLLNKNQGSFGDHLCTIMKRTEVDTAFPATDAFRIWVLNMALEAFRWNEISTGKCIELASLTSINTEEALTIIQDCNSDD